MTNPMQTPPVKDLSDKKPPTGTPQNGELAEDVEDEFNWQFFILLVKSQVQACLLNSSLLGKYLKPINEDGRRRGRKVNRSKLPIANNTLAYYTNLSNKELEVKMKTANEILALGLNREKIVNYLVDVKGYSEEDIADGRPADLLQTEEDWNECVAYSD